MAQLRDKYRAALRFGLLGAALAIYLCLVGIVGSFGKRDVIANVISLGHTVLLLTSLGAAYFAVRRAPAERGTQFISGLVAGLLPGAALALLVAIGLAVDLRAVLLNASPALYALLTLDRGLDGLWFPVAGSAVLGVLATLIFWLPTRFRRPLVWGLTWVFIFGLFSGLLRTTMLARPGWPSTVARFLFAPDGLKLVGVAIVFVLVAGGMFVWAQIGGNVRARVADMPPRSQSAMRWAFIGLGAVLILILPQISGPFVSQVIVLVGLYVLMGLGLNLELGFAGLLDLGFVAFFAIGAYTVGLLTSYGAHGIAGWPFWAAVPVAVLMSLLAGVILGIPVLGIRGDYLAIATLGFGEITRLLVLSDFLAPWLGGSQGVLGIPKPFIGSFEFAGPQQLYYVVVASAALVGFVAWRLRDSRLGRTWMAIREDEDVAEALGINLIQSKLLAYGLGAAFAGLGGAIFATLVTSVFPHSMNLLVSINVVSLIVVGGMGSIPGVVVGSLVLIGLPELFREFSEYRLLFYGAALIAMMLGRPEGLWPSAAIRREMHAEEALEL